MTRLMNPLSILAAIGLMLGAVFGLAGTMTTQPNLQAMGWASIVAGL
jgi:hypothetical protein